MKKYHKLGDLYSIVYRGTVLRLEGQGQDVSRVDSFWHLFLAFSQAGCFFAALFLGEASPHGCLPSFGLSGPLFLTVL